MAWIVLFIAGVFEIVWSFFLKRSDGFTLLVPSAITAVTMFISVVLLANAMKTLPLGTAYCVWTGIGSAGAFLAGIVFLGEAATPLRFVAAALIVAGILLMNLSQS
ncbi:QacE family quaternary ammonium compound efflux SMR transporter [Hyphomicrobium methylovorum]|uniref:SMR family transporter n=1 Tax=Hyphomicrobium methylovorum TaxID=84 RepID=UPI0015E6B7BA|nr:QacE family quaternary ammonium compound efflux SMR transporter [Hyphomicrobium methylovorum]